MLYVANLCGNEHYSRKELTVISVSFIIKLSAMDTTPFKVQGSNEIMNAKISWGPYIAFKHKL